MTTTQAPTLDHTQAPTQLEYMRRLLRPGVCGARLGSSYAPSTCSGGTAEEQALSNTSFQPNIEFPREVVECAVQSPHFVYLLRLAPNGTLDASVFRPKPDAERYTLESAGALDHAPNARILPPDTYLFAFVRGERFIRCTKSGSSAARPIAFGQTKPTWAKLVGLPLPREDTRSALSPDEQARAVNAVGGKLQIGSAGILIRWCVTTLLPSELLRQPLESRVPRVQQIPLPFSKLWLVSLNYEEHVGAWIPDPKARASLARESRARLSKKKSTFFS